MRSGLYDGRVWHMRLRPKRHELAYPLVMTLIDLDEVERLSKALRFFSSGRFNLMDFRPSDHLRTGVDGLKAQVHALLAEHGRPLSGAVRVLCMPRILGAVFNPLTVYFCEDETGKVRAVLYEVNNTFGQRHAYLLPAEGEAVVEHGCEKTFYVSPFNDLKMRYAFKVRPPEDVEGDRASVSISVTDPDGLLMSASFSGVRRPLTDRAIFTTLARHPFLAFYVLFAIHFEALRLWLKGVPLTRRPPPPERFVTASGFDV